MPVALTSASIRRPSSSQHRRVNIKLRWYFRNLLYIIFFILGAFSLYKILRLNKTNDFPTELLSTRPNPPLLSSSSTPQIFQFATSAHNGFGAQFLHLLDFASLAQLMNPPAHLCVMEKRYWNYGCAPYKGWSCYFSTALCHDNNNKTIPKDLMCVELQSIRTEYIWTTHCIRVSTRRSQLLTAAVMRRLAKQHPISSTHFVRNLATSLWHFNLPTSKAIKSRLLTIGLSSLKTETNNYIAIHIRRGDKHREVEQINLRAYVDAITMIAKPKERIFIATDDGNVIQPLREFLPPSHQLLFLNTTLQRQGHKQSTLNRAWMKTKYHTVVDLITEIEIMRHARVFIATFSSNLARMVHTLRQQDERDSISLDDRWEPGVAWLTFGQKYCQWSGANHTFCKMWQQDMR